VEEKPANSTPMLREFLARHDLTCERCGYNLRNITEPLCPECGYVIPRPGTDDLNRDAEGTRPSHRLWCIHCGTDVRGVEGEECPGCGKSLAVKRLRGRPRETARLFPTVPMSYLCLCGLCLLLIGWWVSMTVAKPTLLTARMYGALLVLALPLGALWVWAANRRALEERGWYGRVVVSALTGGLTCLMLGLWLMRT